MMFGKIDRILLIAILIAVLVCIWFLFNNKKDTADQNSLLLAMAQKLHATPAPKEEDQEPEPKPANTGITEEEEQRLLTIADKTVFNLPLDADEQDLKKRYPNEVEKEVSNSRLVVSNIVKKFMDGKTEFDEYEKEFYDINQKHIDELVGSRKLFATVIAKLTTGNTDFTDEELQFQQNHAKEIEKELARLKERADKFKGSNPPLAAGERMKTILSIFDDGIPRTVTQIAEAYALITRTSPSKGNMSTILGTMVKNHNLVCTKAGKDSKVYHGLPEWFDGHKLKPKFKEKIS